MSNLQEKYDQVFLGILQNEGTIPPFLDCIFSFLYRRTDFFRLLDKSDGKMGFPPGVALKLVVESFKKFETIAQKHQQFKAKKDVGDKSQQKVIDMEEVSPVVKEVEIETEQSSCTPPVKEKTVNTCDRKSKAEVSSAESKSKSEKESEKCNTEKSPEEKCSQSTIKTSQEETKKAETSEKSQSSKEEDDDPELTRMQKMYQDNPESYNGAVRDKYSWSQSITDVDVRVDVPKYVKSGKQVKVEMKRKRLFVAYKNEKGELENMVDGDLCWEVRPEESMWTLVPGEHVHINLEKVQERWWDGVYTDEPKISVRKIDPSRPMTDLDDEAQAKIEEMMFNEHRKRMGLPQSHETKVHDMLEKAWNAKGSPFQGQPFDPSKVNVTAPGSMGNIPGMGNNG